MRKIIIFLHIILCGFTQASFAGTEPNNSKLHHYIMQYIVNVGYFPKVSEIAAKFGISDDEAKSSLLKLQDYHGVVLHPKSSEVWVMHPFSSAPTNFWVTTKNGGWWANCAWCALGAAALLNEDVTITTTLGAESKQVSVKIKDGKTQSKNLYIHFPISMSKAWDNVTYTCSNMLLFDSEEEVNKWCRRHGINRGDVQPIQKIFDFAKVWYGNHLKSDWVKWTTEEAKEIFDRFGLTHQIWNIQSTQSRF